MDTALHALNRFGLGARVGERQSLSDPRGWVLAQLTQPPPLLSPAADRDASAALRAVREAQASSDMDARARARRVMARAVAAEMDAALTRRLTTDAPVLERLVSFWSNHLCVSAAGGVAVAALAGAYEREVIRPHVLGRFEDMVLASAAHPAMLIYLDNARSIGPGSPAARRRRAAGRGLNENYARELLELHTLGVDGGYTQQDVLELARLLTGWTVAGLPGRPGPTDGVLRFTFDAQLHEPGDRTVLGVRYAQPGAEKGRMIIRDLCRHPATGRFVARRLVAHFIADAPPQRAVDTVARTFTDTGGDLSATMRTLVECEEAWNNVPRKFRTPQDWVIAVMRALDVDRAAALPAQLRQLRHPLWAPPAPNGFGDTAREWADPDSLLNRAELARTIARRMPRDFDPRTLLDVIDADATGPLRALLEDRSTAADERIALAIAGPAFQWR